MKKKIVLASIVALSLALFVAVGGTIAWLFVTSGPIENTFEPSNINVTLVETTGSTYKMIPGTVLPKDPTVTVENDIDCYVFLKLETNNTGSYLDYEIESEWLPLAGHPGFFYRYVPYDAGVKTFSILVGNKVTVKSSVTKDMMTELINGTAPKPQMIFTAAAIQSENMGNVETAWSNLPDDFKA